MHTQQKRVKLMVESVRNVKMNENFVVFVLIAFLFAAAQSAHER